MMIWEWLRRESDWLRWCRSEAVKISRQKGSKTQKGQFVDMRSPSSGAQTSRNWIIEHSAIAPP
jgi:hypothetical protein